MEQKRRQPWKAAFCCPEFKGALLSGLFARSWLLCSRRRFGSEDSSIFHRHHERLWLIGNWCALELEIRSFLGHEPRRDRGCHGEVDIGPLGIDIVSAARESQVGGRSNGDNL